MFMRCLLVASLVAATCACSSGKSDYDTSGMTSIANGGITMQPNQVKLHADTAPMAVISPTGDFTVGGKPVTVTDAQRAQLVAYYNAARAVHDHGIETGMAGAAMGGAALKGLAEAAVKGDSSKIDSAVNSQTARINEAAAKICKDLTQMQSAQDALKASLAEFKPYGEILESETDGDCSKDASDKKAAD
ncbi:MULTISPECIES: hypothetical protein [Dyella]|uniref:DUF2884 family protein n=2 Tax=Dyella TaxID=231454 RepID=A0A4R0Z188_9GAMM|nr:MULTISPECIES: hypothetical protein [Dyella]TBR39246.1 hypothetical protein EYV96_03160 [Dyella terrae]TCI13168.1 hypothetical protein EZM97_07705 [Dyella soli]